MPSSEKEFDRSFLRSHYAILDCLSCTLPILNGSRSSSFVSNSGRYAETYLWTDTRNLLKIDLCLIGLHASLRISSLIYIPSILSTVCLINIVCLAIRSPPLEVKNGPSPYLFFYSMKLPIAFLYSTLGKMTQTLALSGVTCHFIPNRFRMFTVYSSCMSDCSSHLTPSDLNFLTCSCIRYPVPVLLFFHAC